MSSSSLLAGWPGRRPSTSASQARGSTPFSRRFALVLAEHASRAVEELGFPLGDLIEADAPLIVPSEFP